MANGDTLSPREIADKYISDNLERITQLIAQGVTPDELFADFQAQYTAQTEAQVAQSTTGSTDDTFLGSGTGDTTGFGDTSGSDERDRQVTLEQEKGRRAPTILDALERSIPNLQGLNLFGQNIPSSQFTLEDLFGGGSQALSGMGAAGLLPQSGLQPGQSAIRNGPIPGLGS